MLRRLGLTAAVKLALLVVALAVGIAFPYLVSPFVVSITSLALIFGLFAMSIDLLGGFGGLITLGQAGIMATAGYGVGYVAVRLGGTHLEQILVGLGAGIVVSIVFALLAMRTTGIYFIMVTLAEGMIIWGLSIRLASITGAENGLRGILRPPAVSAYWKYYYVTLAVVTICAGLLWVVTRSPFGLALRGLRESEDRLRMLGYNSTLQKFYVYSVSGVFASVAGVLFVYHNQFISPAAAEFLVSGNGVLMAILGGIGTLVGAVIGAFVIVFAENMLSSYVARWPTLLGIVFIVVILFARQGFVGALSTGWAALIRGLSPAEARRTEVQAAQRLATTLEGSNPEPSPPEEGDERDSEPATP